MFLSADELVRLTGRRRPSAQCRWLDARGWRHVRGADGLPVVLIAEAEHQESEARRRIERRAEQLHREQEDRDLRAEMRLSQIPGMTKRAYSDRDTTFVYVIAISGRARPVKIGMASDVQRRLQSLQNANPDSLELKASFLVHSRRLAVDIEQLTHLNFRKARLHGEWFDVDPGEVASWIASAFAHVLLKL